MILESVDNSPQAWSERARVAPTSWAAAGWSQFGQEQRFDSVLRALNPHAGDRVLDFGCGTGRLLDWLPKDVGYLGFDPSPGMVERAQHEHPGHAFQSWEPHDSGHVFDLIACVGPFNLPGYGWSKEMTWATTRRLWDVFRPSVLVVSLYAGEDERCLRYTPAEVEQHVRDLSYYWTVERHMPNDLLMVVRRESI